MQDAKRTVAITEIGLMKLTRWKTKGAAESKRDKSRESDRSKTPQKQRVKSSRKEGTQGDP